ncbi:hypothetical protein [Mucilaginibacter sp.]
MKTTRFISALLVLLAICSLADAKTNHVSTAVATGSVISLADGFQLRLPPPPPRPRFLPGPPRRPVFFRHRTYRRPVYRHRRAYRVRRYRRY